MSRTVAGRSKTRPSLPNSCRFTPLNTTRSPLSFITPSSMANRRIPTRWMMNSVRVYSASKTSISKWYRNGSSGLHRCGSVTSTWKTPSSLMDNGPTPASVAFTEPYPVIFTCNDTVALFRSSDRSVVIVKSSMCTAGLTSSRTSRKIPENRKKSWSSSHDPAVHLKTSTASLFVPLTIASVTSNSAGVKESVV